jgi:CheY-like chemotaxis protein
MNDDDPLEQVHVLLVEDNPADVEAAMRSLKSQLSDRLMLARDGQEAIEILDQLKSRGECPSMILLDLNLPKVNGIEVLQKIKADRDLRRVPVVMLTTSPREESVVRTYDLGVNTFITKPVRFREVMQAVARVQEYGICLATLLKA